ncbi:MAG: divalent metal cation transporter [Planctomycetaceae bacterium]|nr:divalent metal cation transporter [Planctomycetaceae bacterium]
MTDNPQDKAQQAKIQQEIQHLQEIAARPPVPRALGYIKLTGPGLLQSAMTLGAGSAAASVVAGASFGYKLLWVQPVAMFLGIMMFVALSNIVLTNKERPYWGFMGEMGKIWGPLVCLVFFWALGTVMASVIWHFPQYGLAAGAVRSVVQQFAPTKPPVEDEALIKGEWKMVDGKKVEIQDNWKLIQDEKIPERDWFGFGNVVVDKETGEPKMTTQYTSFGYGISFAAGLVILLINMLVVFNYGRGGVGIRIYEWFLRCMIGLVFLTFLMVVVLNFHKIDLVEMGKGFIGWYAWDGTLLNDPATITLMLGMLGAAVGINMTFMYPYSLLKKNWGTEHKTLAKWDLAMTMFIPFTVITSLIMIGMTVSGIYDGSDVVKTAISPLQAAAALEGGFISQQVATIIFCGGLIGMTFGAISAHMTCCGFVMNEMFKLEPTTWRFRLFALTPSIGIFGVVFQLPFWFPVAASAVCLTMLPIAYLLFLILNNRRSYIGDAVGQGWKRLVFNLLLVIALVMASIGAYIQVKARAVDPVRNYFFPPAVLERIDVVPAAAPIDGGSPEDAN